MTQSGNDSLLSGSIITTRAVSAFGQTGILTIGSNSLIGNHVVTQSGNDSLLSGSIITTRAVSAFGQTGILTIGSNSLIGNHVVAQSGNFVAMVIVLTNGAGIHSIAIIFASRINGFSLYPLVGLAATKAVSAMLMFANQRGIMRRLIIVKSIIA